MADGSFRMSAEVGTLGIITEHLGGEMGIEHHEDEQPSLREAGHVTSSSQQCQE